MRPLPEHQKSVTMSIRFDTVAALDRQTELVKQYRVLHGLHADTM